MTSTLTNVTVSGNTASCGGDGRNAGGGGLGGGIVNNGDLTLQATIVALQLAGGDCELNGIGDRPGESNPRLGPLAFNGGSTQTHALLPGSPAINMVLSGCPLPDTDQRGVARPQGTFCDSGAYELIPVVAPIPALAEWMRPGLLVLLIGSGLLALRRRVVACRGAS